MSLDLITLSPHGPPATCSGSGLIRYSDDRPQTVLDEANEIIYRATPDGHFTFVNSVAASVVRRDVEDCLGRHFLSLIRSDYREKAREFYGRQLEQREPATYFEFPILTQDGSEIWIGQYVHLVVEQGKVVELKGVARDISERKRKEQQLADSTRDEEHILQSQKVEAIGQLAGGVAHDFNNLLTAITGYAEMALRRLEAGTTVHSHVEEIQKAAQRAVSLTRQLLAFSRREVLQPRICDLNTIVTEMEKMLRRLIGENLSLTTKLDSNLGCIKADPGQLEQVVMNLVVNARDASAENGCVTIETANVFLPKSHANDDGEFDLVPYVMLAVIDNGVGMDEATQNRIFEPFFTTKEAGKGTGLGLSTVYTIVEQNGGKIKVESEPRKGAVFKVLFPQVDREPLSVTESVTKEIPKGNETIFVVEDDDIVRDLARHILELSGYDVLSAADGREALEFCATHSGPIHLLLTDVVMPQMNGPRLAEEVRTLRPDIKTVFMSGYADNPIVERTLAGGVTAFLHKPFSPASLLTMIRETLDSPSGANPTSSLTPAQDLFNS